MQTLLSANQSARTILVFYKARYDMVSDLRKREHQYLHAGKYHNNLKHKISVHDKLKGCSLVIFSLQRF